MMKEFISSGPNSPCRRAAKSSQGSPHSVTCEMQDISYVVAVLNDGMNLSFDII